MSTDTTQDMTEDVGWKTLAAKRHSPSVLAGAAAVLAVPYLYADPGMIHYGAAAVLGSGIVAGVIEGVRSVYHTITDLA